MPNTTRTNLQSEIVPVALARALDRLNSDVSVTGFVTNYTTEARAKGSRFADAVRVPKRGAVAAVNKVAGTAVTFSQAVSTEATININRHKTWDILVEDGASLFTGAETLAGYLSDGAVTLAEAIEADTIAASISGAGKNLGTVAAAANYNLVRTIRKNARQDKWRLSSQPAYAFWNPSAEEQLLNETLFVKANERGQADTLKEGAIGRVLGFDHYGHNGLPAVAGSPTAGSNLAFQREGIGIAFVDMSVQDMPEEFRGSGFQMAMDYTDDFGRPIYTMRVLIDNDQKERGIMISLDTIYGVAVVRSELVYHVRNIL